MILDALLLLDDKAALTASRASTNVIDFGTNRDIGNSMLPLIWQFTTLPVSAGASTLVIAVQTSTDNSTWQTLLQSDAMPKANFTAQAPWGYFRPMLPLGIQRYLRLNYTVGTANFTAGNVTASLALDRDAWDRFYPRNYNV